MMPIAPLCGKSGKNEILLLIIIYKYKYKANTNANKQVYH